MKFDAQYHRARRRKLKLAGKCIHHCKRPVAIGIYCRECVDKRNRRRKLAVRQGFCRDHIKRRAQPGTAFCRPCLRRYDAHNKKRVREAKRLGHCINHQDVLVVKGRVVCRKCLWNAMQRRSGWSEDQYLAAYQKQKGLCAICSTKAPQVTTTSKNKVLQGDHDHTAGKIRGLLCFPCNVTLGHFGDDLARLLRFARNVEKYLVAYR
jgi:hypothetical protein